MNDMIVGTAALDEELRRRRVKRRVIGIDDGPVVIGRYVVVAAIDEGAMGVVYEAHDPELERAVALKVLRPRDAELGARLLREARSVARVSHANVVGIHEVGSSAWGVYLAMELVRGPTLRQWCAQRRGRAEIVEMFAQAALGLHAAHRAGVVHRDVKPDNVRITDDRHDATSLGTARVLDFGLACTTGSVELAADEDDALGDLQLTGTGELIGTPAYMSPEQFEGGAITPASDQFSLCVALFEATTGTMPFAGATATQRRDEVIAGRLRRKPLAALPPALARAIAKGLAHDPKQRHTDMLALVTALRGTPKRQLHRKLAIVSAVVALAGLAALAVGSTPAPEPPAPPTPPIAESPADHE